MSHRTHYTVRQLEFGEQLNIPTSVNRAIESVGATFRRPSGSTLRIRRRLCKNTALYRREAKRLPYIPY